MKKRLKLSKALLRVFAQKIGTMLLASFAFFPNWPPYIMGQPRSGQNVVYSPGWGAINSEVLNGGD